MRHYSAHVVPGFGKDDPFCQQFPEKISRKNFGCDANTGAAGLGEDFQFHGRRAQRSSFDDTSHPVELGFQPFERQFLPDDFEAREACAGQCCAAAFHPCLELIFDSWESKRAVEPIRVAQRGPNRLAGKRQIVMGFEGNYGLHLPVKLSAFAPRGQRLWPLVEDRVNLLSS